MSVPSSPLALLELEGKYILDNAPQVKEQELLSWVMTYATACNWVVYHTYRSYRSPSGFPDLVLLKPSLEKVLFVELKRMGREGKIRPAQQVWLDGLRDCGLDVRVWRPNDVSEIIETLSPFVEARESAT